MKKIMTILLAAALSGTMLVGLTACSNNNNQNGTSNAQSASTVNPFADLSSAPAASEQSSTAGDNTDAETPSQESSLPADESSTAPQPSDVTQPSVSVSIAPASDISDTSKVSDGGQSSFQISNITPQGTVNPAYAGNYVLKMDWDAINPADYGVSSLEEYKAYFDMISMNMTLNADGTASSSASMMGQSSSSDNGSWLADGTTVYVTIEGSTAEFTYDNGKLINNQQKGMYLDKQ